MAVEKKHFEEVQSIVGKYELIKRDPEVIEFIELADEAMAAIGYTEHGFRHVTLVAENAGMILEKLGYPEDEVELAKIAGLLHDVGNLIAREDHPQSAAAIVYPILRRFQIAPRFIGIALGAIGNHEQAGNLALNAVTAALIIADKADVHRSRVRSYHPELKDIHDDVNFACTEATLSVNTETKELVLDLTVDTEIASVMEYFEIFTERMMVTKLASEFLGLEFKLVINGTVLT